MGIGRGAFVSMYLAGFAHQLATKHTRNSTCVWCLVFELPARGGGVCSLLFRILFNGSVTVPWLGRAQLCQRIPRWKNHVDATASSRCVHPGGSRGSHLSIRNALSHSICCMFCRPILRRAKGSRHRTPLLDHNSAIQCLLVKYWRSNR